MRRRLLLARLLVLGAGVSLIAIAPASPAAAHDCSSDADCEQTGGYNGAIAVVGGIAAVAAAAATAIARTPKGEETDLSILQVDRDEVEVTGGSPAIVTLTGWHVGNDGQQRVPMTIWISAPADAPVTVVPDQADGQLVATISLDENKTVEGDRCVLTAHGVWKGREVTQTITVRFGDDFLLRLRGDDNPGDNLATPF